VEPYREWYDVRVYPRDHGISVFFRTTTKSRQAEEALRSIEWMIKKDSHHYVPYDSVYGDLTAHNTNRTILDAVGKETLQGIAEEYENRPQFIVTMAIHRIEVASRLIGLIVERKRAEASIRHRATFPQLNPIQILGFNVKEEVLFINPSMKSLLERRSIHDPRQFIPPEWSRRLLDPGSIEEAGNVQEITVAGRIFNEHISFIQEFQTLRIYAVDITETKRIEEERERLLSELQDALAQIKTLHGILPICMFCKKIRDDKDSWRQLEGYISDHSEAKFSHGICPECAKKHGYD
jgi:hypothetical protein